VVVVIFADNFIDMVVFGVFFMAVEVAVVVVAVIDA